MLASFLLMAAASQVPIEVGKFDPSQFPNAKAVERRIPHSELTARVDRILDRKQCKFEGQHAARYAITVPYAILIDTFGKATKIVVKEIGCAPVELLAGQFARELSEAGDFKRNQGDQWYVGEAHFTHGGDRLARTLDDENRVVCEAAKNATGSRLAKKRDCRTVAQWRVYNIDRERQRRDLLGDGTSRTTN